MQPSTSYSHEGYQPPIKINLRDTVRNAASRRFAFSEKPSYKTGYSPPETPGGYFPKISKAMTDVLPFIPKGKIVHFQKSPKAMITNYHSAH